MVSRLVFPFYLLLLALFTFLLSKYPGHNGDMPFYIVCAIQLDRGSMDGAVDEAVVHLKQELPPDEFIEHSGRIKKATTEYFDFYRIKPLYVLLILLFHKIGFSYTHSTVYPSLLFFFLTGITIWRFCIQFLDSGKTFLVSLLSVSILPMNVLARLSTPDAMSCFFLLNALLFIYTDRNRMIWFLLLLLAICTRMDNIIGVLILLLALSRWPNAHFSGRLRFKEFAFYSMVLIIVAIMINLIFTEHILRINDPLSERTTFGYLTNVKWYLVAFSGSFLMTLIILFIFTRSAFGFSWKSEVNYMIYVILGIVFIRFLLYPFYEERFFTPYVIFGMLIIAFQFSSITLIEKVNKYK
jgi:hypothetical protein